MTTVKQIYDIVNSFAPFGTELDWDNCGLIVGDMNAEVTAVGTALDITADVIDQAVEQGINLIVSHHPVIFKGLKSVTPAEPAALLIKYGIAAICAHTNLDAAAGGVNDLLCSAVSMKNTAGLFDPEAPGKPPLGRIGEIEPIPVTQFANQVKEVLGAAFVRHCGDRTVSKVAVCCGAGGDMLPAAVAAGADLFLTGDIGYHDVLLAQQNEVAVIAAGHYDTEKLIKSELCRRIAQKTNLKTVIFEEKEPFSVI